MSFAWELDEAALRPESQLLTNSSSFSTLYANTQRKRFVFQGLVVMRINFPPNWNNGDGEFDGGSSMEGRIPSGKVSYISVWS